MYMRELKFHFPRAPTLSFRERPNKAFDNLLEAHIVQYSVCVLYSLAERVCLGLRRGLIIV